jgi:hypothetical protein
VDDLVVIETVPTAMEAGLVCGILRNVGIRCFDRPTNYAAGANDGWALSGWREVVVRSEDADEATKALAAQRADPVERGYPQE